MKDANITPTYDPKTRPMRFVLYLSTIFWVCVLLPAFFMWGLFLFQFIFDQMPPAIHAMALFSFIFPLLIVHSIVFPWFILGYASVGTLLFWSTTPLFALLLFFPVFFALLPDDGKLNYSFEFDGTSAPVLGTTPPEPTLEQPPPSFLAPPSTSR